MSQLNPVSAQQSTYPVEFSSAAAEIRERFYVRWARYFSTPQQEAFLHKWVSAFEAYGSPLALIIDTTLKREVLKVGGDKFDCWHWNSENISEMERVRAARVAYYQALRLVDGQDSIPSQSRVRDCHLCQNLSRAEDCERQGNSAQSNLIFDLKDYHILPNRYGLLPGESLVVPIAHDETQSRSPIRYERDANVSVRRISCEPGKTRGRILSAADLIATTAIADELDMAWSRNHPCSGMSIPEHDHFHLWPSCLIPSEIVDSLAGSKEANSSQLNYRITDTSPFSVLELACSEIETLSRAAYEILHRLEHADQPYIISYFKNRLAICPIKLMDDRCVKVPSLVAMNNFNVTEDVGKNWARISHSLFARDEFKWEQYF